jgi:RNA polymerase sigma-70 factor (ECF subfamily)
MEEPADEIDLNALLKEARNGSGAAVAILLKHYRPYLTVLARLRTSRQLQPKFDDSDLVQETLVLVQRDLRQFRGTTEAELTAWLRRIMASVIGKFMRHYATQRRDVSLERRLEDQFSQSSRIVGQVMLASDTSPSEKSVKRERAVILSQAIAQLPADYREALILHRLEGLTMTRARHQQHSLRWPRWAIFASIANLAVAGWGWSTRPNSSPSAAASR